MSEQRVCVSLVFEDQEAWFSVDTMQPWRVLQETCAYLWSLDPAITAWRGRDPLLVELWPQVLEGPGYRTLLGEAT